jgi:spore maturation protein CgeB
MIEIIKWWLTDGDKQKEGFKIMPQQGKETVLKNFTYEKRLEVLLNTIFPTETK